MYRVSSIEWRKEVRSQNSGVRRLLADGVYGVGA